MAGRHASTRAALFQKGMAGSKRIAYFDSLLSSWCLELLSGGQVVAQAKRMRIASPSLLPMTPPSTASIPAAESLALPLLS